MSDTFDGSSVNFYQIAGSPNAVLAAVAMLDNAKPGQSLNEFVAQNNAMAALSGVSLPNIQISEAASVGRAIGGVASQEQGGGISV